MVFFHDILNMGRLFDHFQNIEFSDVEGVPVWQDITLSKIKIAYRSSFIAKDCKHFNVTCSLRVIHPQLLKQIIIYFCIYMLSLQKWNIYVGALCTYANTFRFSPVAVKTHQPICKKIFESYWRFSDIMYDARTVAVEIVPLKF